MISYQILTIWWSIFHEKSPQRCFIRNTLNSFFNWRSRTISHNFRNFESSRANQTSLGNRVSKTTVAFSQRKFSLFFLAAVILVERLSWFVLRFMIFLETTVHWAVDARYSTVLLLRGWLVLLPCLIYKHAWEQRNVTTAAEKLLARMAFVIFIVTKWILIKKNSKAWRRSLRTTQQIFQGSWRYAFDALPQHQILQTNSSMFFLWRNFLLNDSKLIKKLKFLSKKLTICRFRCMWCDQ